MMLSGRYVATSKEATHALPEGMHMDSDYPYMLPEVRGVTAKSLTLIADRAVKTVELKIRRYKGREWVEYSQKSSFEHSFCRQPTKFRFYPFKAEGPK